VVAESAEAEPFLDLVRAAFALSDIMNWRRVTSGLINEEDGWNRILEESERGEEALVRFSTQRVGPSLSSASVSMLTSVRL
jgi:hypothetical protein